MDISNQPTVSVSCLLAIQAKFRRMNLLLLKKAVNNGFQTILNNPRNGRQLVKKLIDGSGTKKPTNFEDEIKFKKIN